MSLQVESSVSDPFRSLGFGFKRRFEGSMWVSRVVARFSEGLP